MCKRRAVDRRAVAGTAPADTIDGTARGCGAAASQHPGTAVVLACRKGRDPPPGPHPHWVQDSFCPSLACAAAVLIGERWVAGSAVPDRGRGQRCPRPSYHGRNLCSAIFHSDAPRNRRIRAAVEWPHMWRSRAHRLLARPVVALAWQHQVKSCGVVFCGWA